MIVPRLALARARNERQRVAMPAACSVASEDGVGLVSGLPARSRNSSVSATRRHPTPRRTLAMARPATLANQRSILKNQRALLKNQGAIMANQRAILANQRRILANQKRILAK